MQPQCQSLHSSNSSSSSINGNMMQLALQMRKSSAFGLDMMQQQQTRPSLQLHLLQLAAAVPLSGLRSLLLHDRS
jgi:hypothetical protein